MGLGCIFLIVKGALKKDFPRYEYQYMRWERHGIKNKKLEMQKEILVQAFANISFLAAPAMLMSFNTNDQISIVEIFAGLLWVRTTSSFAFDSFPCRLHRGSLRVSPTFRNSSSSPSARKNS